MYAEHVIATPIKSTQADMIASLKLIKKSGSLIPKTHYELGEGGHLFDLDRIAGDDQYVFLSGGPMMRIMREPSLCYGFLFNPAELILRCNALVGPGLISHYSELIDECIKQVDAQLPPLPEATTAELQQFAEDTYEDDPALLAYLKQKSTSHYFNIEDAIFDKNWNDPGARQAYDLFLSRATVLQTQKRHSGKKALAMLKPGCEILIPGSLSLAWAIGTIEAGQLIPLA